MKILTMAVLLFISMLAFADEEKKPKYTWEYHLITWMPPNVERKDNIFPFTRESRCRTFLERIALVLDGAREEAPNFGWVGICSPVKKS